jgi:hypothetical protein
MYFLCKPRVFGAPKSGLIECPQDRVLTRVSNNAAHEKYLTKLTKEYSSVWNHSNLRIMRKDIRDRTRERAA